MAAPTVWLLTFTIDESANPDAPFAVAGDGAAESYQDYRLGTQLPNDPNYCVEASPSNGLFIRMNRLLDSQGTLYCAASSSASARQYVVHINNEAACQELSDGGYPTGPGAPCVFTGADKPRIRITNDPYGRRTTQTPVAFLSKWYDTSAISYELRTEQSAAVLNPGFDPSQRIMSYSGNARLWRFEPGVKERAVAEAFPLPFQMTFMRTAQ